MFRAPLLLLIAFLGLGFAGQNWQVQVTWPNADFSWSFLKFYPQSLTINAGDNVTWILRSEANTITFPYANYPLIVGGDANFFFYHPLVLPFGGDVVLSPTDTVSSGFLFPGLSATLTFPNADTNPYTYMDLLHGFVGSITVLDAAAALPFTPDEVAANAATEAATDLSTIDAYIVANNLNSTDFPEILADGTKVVHVGFMDPKTGASMQRYIPTVIDLQVGDRVMFMNPTLHVHTVAINQSGNFLPQYIGFNPNITVLNGTYGEGVPEGPKIFLSPSPSTVLNGYIGGYASGGLLVPYANVNITFSAPGAFPYECSFHYSLGMKGVITVTSSAPAITVSIAFVMLIASLLM